MQPVILYRAHVDGAPFRRRDLDGHPSPDEESFRWHPDPSVPAHAIRALASANHRGRDGYGDGHPMGATVMGSDYAATIVCAEFARMEVRDGVADGSVSRAALVSIGDEVEA